jgi:hypothetical protein
VLNAARIGGEHSDVEGAKRVFLFHDSANPHRHESFVYPLADLGIDGELRVFRDALEAAQNALLSHPADEHERSEAQGVIDHYMRRFAAVQRGEPDPFGSETGAVDPTPIPVSTDAAGRGIRDTPLGRAYTKVLRRRAARDKDLLPQRRARARDRLRKHGGEAALREVVARDVAARRQEHDLPKPPDYSAPWRGPGR